VLARQDALAFGVASWRLGAGRARKEDPVQAAAGIELHAKPGDPVAEGAPLFTMHSDEPARFARALEALEGGWSIADAAPERTPLIIERL
jgi:thymidine phosphorylase